MLDIIGTFFAETLWIWARISFPVSFFFIRLFYLRNITYLLDVYTINVDICSFATGLLSSTHLVRECLIYILPPLILVACRPMESVVDIFCVLFYLLVIFCYCHVISGEIAYLAKYFCRSLKPEEGVALDVMENIISTFSSMIT